MDFIGRGEGDKAAQDFALAKRIGEVLARHYPGHPWMVEAECGTAMVATIKLLYCDELGRISRYGFLMHLTSLDDPDAAKKIMMLGGELLERYGLARKKADEQSRIRAQESPLIMDNAVLKSRH